MSHSTEPSHYDTLKVARDAAPEDVRRAYRRAAQQNHPDRQPSDAAAQERMARINEAYAVLSHPQRRVSYDQWLVARSARERAQAAAQAARPSRFAASWPWGLVAATMAITFGTVGTVWYKSAVPTVAITLPASQLAGR
jgi:DnaJ-class molecular chaperone